MNTTGLHCLNMVTQTKTTNQLLPSMWKNTTVPYFDGYKNIIVAHHLKMVGKPKSKNNDPHTTLLNYKLLVKESTPFSNISVPSSSKEERN